MIVRIAVRGFAGRELLFEDRVEITDTGLGSLLPKLAEQHAAKMAAHELHMIEIKFLDEPNENERFFRFGTDPAGMVLPIQIDLGGGAN